jgi:ribosomal protein S4
VSARPVEAKQIARLRKALRATPASSINLIEWLRDRRYASTAGAARRLLTDGKVKVDSHVIGRERAVVGFEDDKETPIFGWAVAPYVPAEIRAQIRVER